MNTVIIIVFRLVSPRFSDKLSAPKVSASGNPLPLARVVSRTIHPDEGLHEHAGTVMVVAWGQFMDHDLTLTATPLGKCIKLMLAVLGRLSYVRFT